LPILVCGVLLLSSCGCSPHNLLVWSSLRVKTASAPDARGVYFLLIPPHTALLLCLSWLLVWVYYLLRTTGAIAETLQQQQLLLLLLPVQL
jgi:hypothetical protein